MASITVRNLDETTKQALRDFMQNLDQDMRNWFGAVREAAHALFFLAARVRPGKGPPDLFLLGLTVLRDKLVGVNDH